MERTYTDKEISEYVDLGYNASLETHQHYNGREIAKQLLQQNQELRELLDAALLSRQSALDTIQELLQRVKDAERVDFRFISSGSEKPNNSTVKENLTVQTEPDVSCGSCKHFKFKDVRGFGWCDCPLPIWMYKQNEPERTMLCDSGKNCPAFVQREEVSK